MVRIAKPVLTSALLVVLGLAQAVESPAADSTDPETAIRTLVRANAEKDIATLSRLMAHDADITSYTIGGRKYVGCRNLNERCGKNLTLSKNLRSRFMS